MHPKLNLHLLSGAIFVAAASNILETFLSTLLRFVLARDASLTPDMLDERLWKGQLILSLLQISVTALAFYTAWRRHRRIETLLSKDSISGSGAETPASSSPIVQPSYSTEQLLQVWASVLIGAGIFYNITSLMYRRFIDEVMSLINMTDNITVYNFVSIYNNSHGFKYVGMMIALLLGIFITGVFLKDNKLKLSSFAVTITYLAAFLVIEMTPTTLLGRSIGIVWTSVIFHLLQTVGLLALALYLSVKYRED